MSETAPGSAAPDPLAVIGELTAVLEGVRADLRSLRDELRSVREDSEARDAALAESGKRSRRIITGLVISFCLDLIITAGFGYNTIRVNGAQDASRATITQLHASNVSACQQANVNRAEDIAIWNTFLGELVPAAARTPGIEAKLDVINAAIRVKDAPRNCELLYATKG